MNERGLSLIWFLVAVFLVFAFIFVACDALLDDEDEPGDLGMPAATMSDYERDGDEGSRNRNGNDCHEAEAECHDSDFSPQFDESPVTLIVCVEPESCRFG